MKSFNLKPLNIFKYLSKLHDIRYLLILAITTFMIGCGEKPVDIVNDNNVLNSSQTNGKLSHHSGENCAGCHKEGGTGKGWFTISGTIYDSIQSKPYPNCEIRLYSGINESGDLIRIIYGDSLGNFFTTENVQFGNGLYPVVYGKWSIAKMGSQITLGNCNSCHGITTNRIKLR